MQKNYSKKILCLLLIFNIFNIQNINAEENNPSYYPEDNAQSPENTQVDRRRVGGSVRVRPADVELPSYPPARPTPATVNAPVIQPILPANAQAVDATGGATVSIPTPPPANPNRQTGLQAVDTPIFGADVRAAPVPDRWRIVDTLKVIEEKWYDPYNQNTLKGDKPIYGDDWFLNISAIADTTIEPRRVVTPVGIQGSQNPGSNDIFSGDEQFLFSQNFIFPIVYYKGNTTFKPPEQEYHFTPVLNYNYVSVKDVRALRIDPSEGRTRRDYFVGLQELFADIHLHNVSDRYDFDSIRFGIQPFSTDFRGFLFQDNQLGVRLFGNRANNRYQYNLGWFRKLEKDTNSGLNDPTRALRRDEFFVANLYAQDTPNLGFTSQVTAVYNRNREGQRPNFYNTNGFIERPASLGFERARNYDALYLGYNGDGHFGKLNLTTSAYLATGSDRNNPFTDRKATILASFLAAEASFDQDWIRWRASGLYASGDKDPFDDRETGFDAIFENPIFAGADTSYWIRQSVPLVGGGGVNLSNRNGMLNSLRTSSLHGQSNFVNPGTVLLGVGADFDISPQFRLSANVNQLYFARTEVLETVRNQGRIRRNIGTDASLALIWRPFFTQNIVVRLSAAGLLPGSGFKDLFPDNKNPYSILLNTIFTY